MSLSVSQISEAARILWSNWETGTRIEALPVHCRPGDRAEGYAIAREVARLSGFSTAGWKIAATSEAGQKHINVDGPLAARVLSGKLLRPGAVIPLQDNIMRVAEAEFAFRFARDLPRRPADYTVDEVMGAVSSLHLSMEVPDSRYQEFVKVGASQLIADTSCAAWLVIGDSRPVDWRGIHLKDHRVDAYVDGRHAAQGTGRAALGDPRIALTWLVNEVSRYGDGIHAGEIVTTGTCIKPVVIAPGAKVRFDYGVLGTLEAEIT